jgi:hypothetical protein
MRSEIVEWILADPNNFGDTRGGGLAGPTGLVVILLLVVATIFLIRSMNARLRRLPERFPTESTAESVEGEPSPDDGMRTDENAK